MINSPIAESASPASPGVAAAAKSREATPIPTLESIQTRLNTLLAEKVLVETELARRKTEETKAKQEQQRGFISNLPNALDQVDLVGVIHLLAEVAGVQARVYRLRNGASVAAKAPNITKGRTTHGRGYRLSEYEKAQIMDALRKPNRNMSEIKRRFGVAAQTVYLYKAKVDKEDKRVARAAAR